MLLCGPWMDAGSIAIASVASLAEPLRVRLYASDPSVLKYVLATAVPRVPSTGTDAPSSRTCAGEQIARARARSFAPVKVVLNSQLSKTDKRALRPRSL